MPETTRLMRERLGWDRPRFDEHLSRACVRPEVMAPALYRGRWRACRAGKEGGIAVLRARLSAIVFETLGESTRRFKDRLRKPEARRFTYIPC